MDFDDLKRLWDACDDKLAVGFRLNTRRLRSMLTPHANAPVVVDIDYTMPVMRAQKQFSPNPIVRIVRAAAMTIRDRWQVDRIVRTFQGTVTRLLRRYLTLRG